MTAFTRTASDRANHARFSLQSGYPIWVKAQNNRAYCVFAAENVSSRQLAYLHTLNSPVRLILRAWNSQAPQSDLNWQVIQISLDARTTPEVLAGYLDPLKPCKIVDKESTIPRSSDPYANFESVLKLCRRFQLLPALVVAECDFVDGDEVTIHKDDIDYMLSAPVQVRHVSSATVPIKEQLDAQLHVFRLDDTQEEHYALTCGPLSGLPSPSAPPLVRLHSVCMTGDVFGSLKCDCGPQLNAALEQITQAEAGVLVYLMQEGRGIGLANKMRAYTLQENGRDTVQANHALGFEDDERDFRIGAEILKVLGLHQVRLLTNNPRKVDTLLQHDITVTERIPLIMTSNKYNAGYLRTKAQKSGHLL